MKCEQLMKRDVECVAPTDPVDTAARRMRDENVGFLPVCDKDRKILGAVTDRDLAVRIIAEGKPLTTPVKEVMTKEVVTVRPEDDLSRAEQLMGQKHKSRIMCVDGQHRLVGVISLSDIAQHEGPRATETLRRVSEREARA